MTTTTPRGAGSPPLSSPRWSHLPAALLVLWGGTLLVFPDARHPWALGVGALALLLILVLALFLDRRDRAVRVLRAELDELHVSTESLARVHLPRLVERLREGDSAETALHRIPLPEDAARQNVVRAVAAEIATAERRRSAAMVACATAAGRMQALTTTMLADLRRMQERYGDGDTDSGILGDLMHLDHSTAQAGRIADSIAVLTGARSGRRWSRAIGVESILRGAMARIGAYRRVRLHNVPRQAIAGFAAEGVIHAVAELLDNAAKFSPPTSEVHVHVEEVQAGIAIMIEDSGLVMGEEALRRAREGVSGDADITTISGSRLGLSVVGRIARRYDLSVSFRSSSRGGTAVVLLLPNKLIKPLPAASAPAARPEPADSEPVRVAAPDNAPDIATDPDTGLPQRRRGQTLAAAQATAPRPVEDSGPPTSPRGFGAFRAAVRGQDQNGTPKDA
ncbi:ATP-binding protein [Nocardiopsis sp. N85]|uniref:ATP-binding protein n=1 Tax=Nocardiopsis sp. N85 TaxID=3029400 RepID=UPI00237F042D|nr:ATP-binding protein [Nocardiopsis sp. N85]MDE3723271.1 ATP-binding protein [Nocardiopsis sp. N85]